MSGAAKHYGHLDPINSEWLATSFAQMPVKFLPVVTTKMFHEEKTLPAENQWSSGLEIK